jgi:hypothetical protein
MVADMVVDMVVDVTEGDSGENINFAEDSVEGVMEDMVVVVEFQRS